MSGQRKQSLFIIAYQGRDAAEKVYGILRDLEKQDKIDIKTAATVHRNDDGKLKLQHKRRVTTWKGALGGGAIALLLVGTGGGAVLGGALLGALAGSTRSGQRRDVKKFLDDKLGLHDSALAVLVNDADWATVSDAIAHYGGEYLAVELAPEAQQEIAALAADREVSKAVMDAIEVEEEGPAEEA